jgi:hypothetical protein
MPQRAERAGRRLAARGTWTYDEKVKPDPLGGESGQASGAQDEVAERDLRSDRRARRRERALSDFAWTIRLMDSVVRTEKDMADTLQVIAGADESETASRRLRLAEAAIKGAEEAAERSEQLRRLADRWATHADAAALFQLLYHAGAVLADLASTEENIATELTSLASKDGSGAADERRHLADEALAGAQRARDQAGALRRLAEASAARVQPTVGGPAGREANRKISPRRGRERMPEDRDGDAADRDEAAEGRDVAAQARDQKSVIRDAAAQARDEVAALRDQGMRTRLYAADQRDSESRAREAAAQARDAGSVRADASQLAWMWEEVAAMRQQAADQREAAAAERMATAILLEGVRQDRRAAAADRAETLQDREAAVRDREAAAKDREAAAADRQQAAIEQAQERIPDTRE